MKQNLDEYKNDILWKEDPNTIHIRSDLLVSERVVDMLGDVSDKRIIDLGCGNGKVSRWLNKKGAKVTGVDALEDQIDIARQVSSQEDDNINYFIADISDDDFKSPEEDFDVAVALMVHLYLDKKEFIQSIKNVYQTIKDGGKFIYGNIHPCRVLVSDNQKASILNTPSDKINYFDIQELSSTLTSNTNTTTTTSYFNHPLEFVLNTLIDEGFKIKHIQEPRATEDELKKYPNLLSSEDRLPSYIIIECEK